MNETVNIVKSRIQRIKQLVRFNNVLQRRYMDAVVKIGKLKAENLQLRKALNRYGEEL